MRLEPAQGTSRAYTLTRLESERPDLYERVCRKELSANAAAIEAGFRKPPGEAGPAAVQSPTRSEAPRHG